MSTVKVGSALLKTSCFVNTYSNDELSTDLHQGLLALTDEECGPSAIQALSLRSERLLLRAGDFVLKVHSDDTCPQTLSQRLQLIGQATWSEIFLQPSVKTIRTLNGGRVVTVWPLGRALHLGDEDLPWVESARLLAALHRLPLHEGSRTSAAPRSRALLRWHKAVDELKGVDSGARDQDWLVIHEAAATLDLKVSEERALQWVHGDWHLGQLVDIGSEESPAWRLIDIEDMGVGEAIWDLARPAAFYAAGLLPREDWESFLEAYRIAEGPALPRTGDVWCELEKPARALIVQSAATSWHKARREARELYPDERVLVETCLRIKSFEGAQNPEQLSS